MSATDHDQRQKILIKEFFSDFLRDYFPAYASRINLDNVDWLDKEVFLDPPTGERRFLDLVAKVEVLEPVDTPHGKTEGPLLAMVLIEIASRASTVPVKAQVYGYYAQLRRQHGLPVLPLCVYLNVGLEGIGWDAYVEKFWEETVLTFRYGNVGLPELNAAEYIDQKSLLSTAWTALMKKREDQQVELYTRGLERIAGSGETDQRKYLLLESLEAYQSWDETHWEEVQRRLMTMPETGVGRVLSKTTYERGMESEAKRLVKKLVERRFGALSAAIAQRLDAMPLPELEDLGERLLTATSLRELGLE